MTDDYSEMLIACCVRNITHKKRYHFSVRMIIVFGIPRRYTFRHSGGKEKNGWNE